MIYMVGWILKHFFAGWLLSSRMKKIKRVKILLISGPLDSENLCYINVINKNIEDVRMRS